MKWVNEVEQRIFEYKGFLELNVLRRPYSDRSPLVVQFVFDNEKNFASWSFSQDNKCMTDWIKKIVVGQSSLYSRKVYFNRAAHLSMAVN